MKIGPKYKIAKRLGRAVFEKTQTPKFALVLERTNKSADGVRSRSNYGSQLLEKQKVRFTYGITAKQLGNCVKKIILSKSRNPEEKVFAVLEKRLDNVIFRAGFASTRRQARQIVSHGHVRVNEIKTNIPSYTVKNKDKIRIKDSSKTKTIFLNINEKSKDQIIPSWMKIDYKNLTIEIIDDPKYNQRESHFNLSEVVQFYNR